MLGTNESKLKIIIDAENRASREIKAAQKGVKGLSNNLEKMKPAFKKMALIGAAGFAAVAAGVNTTTKAAVDAEEVFNKFNVVFGEVGDRAESVAKDLRDNFGLAESSAKDLLSSTGDMLTGFGMTGGQALDLAEKTNKLAVDLASFTNIEGGAERASRALTKALLGERESVKELGIAILEEDVKAKIKAMEVAGKFTNETERQKKAMATLEIAYEQSKNAMGDFERTQESLANRERVLAERTKELKETMGKAFLPIREAVLGALEPIISSLREWIEKNPELAKGIVLVTGGAFALLGVVGALGLVIPPLTTGFLKLRAAVIALRISFISLQTVAILALITAFVAIIVYAIKKVNEFADEFGGMGNAIQMILWNMKISVLKFVEAALNALSKIPIMSGMIQNSLTGVRRSLRETEANFNALAVEGMRKTKKEGEELTEGINELSESIINDLGAAGDAGDEFAKAMDDAFKKALEGIKSIRDEIKGVKEDLEEANKTYLKNEEKEREDYEQNIIEMVANAEEEIKRLEEEKIQAMAAGDIKRTRSLEQEIAKQREIIQTYHSLELELDHRIAEEKERLAMNELERLTFDHEKKLLMMKKEHLEEQVLRLKRLIELEKEHNKAMDYIGEEKMAAINADIEKEKSFRKLLEEKTGKLGKWFDDALEGYQKFVGDVNNTLDNIKPPTPSTGFGVGLFPSPSMESAQSTEDVLKYQHGGVVPGPIGQPVPALVHGGETVIPANKSLGSIYLTITGNTFMSDEEAAEKIGDKIIRVLKNQNRFIY